MLESSKAPNAHGSGRLCRLNVQVTETAPGGRTNNSTGVLRNWQPLVSHRSPGSQGQVQKFPRAKTDHKNFAELFLTDKLAKTGREPLDSRVGTVSIPSHDDGL